MQLSPAHWLELTSSYWGTSTQTYKRHKHEKPSMPIDIEQFDREAGFGSAQTQGERIVAFLAENSDKAYQRDEIAEGTGIDPNTVSAVLSRLKERKLVRHKPPYWAIGEPERVREAMDLARDLDTFDDRLGAEDMDEWRTAGGDEPQSRDRPDKNE